MAEIFAGEKAADLRAGGMAPRRYLAPSAIIESP